MTSAPIHLRRRTLAAHAIAPEERTRGALVPPIEPSTTFERAPDGTYPGGASYIRDQSPSYRPVEALLTHLEGGVESLVFSSGMAAANAVLDALPRGSRVVAPSQMYWALRRRMESCAAEGAIELRLFDAGAPGSIEGALAGECALLWLETPANPTLEVTNLREAVHFGHAAGATVVADNTVATPVHTRPIEHGVDIVHHAATKALNGHGDVLAGTLTTAKHTELWARVREQRAARGAVLGPFEAWLLLRGMRTLYLRVEVASRNALEVARFLESHAAVAEVIYPGLPSHPGHGIAASQMRDGFGSLSSFRVRGGEEAARAVAAATTLITQATSLGGTESLIEHRASIEGTASTLPRDLLRLSVGIEDVGDLIRDLEQALPV